MKLRVLLSYSAICLFTLGNAGAVNSLTIWSRKPGNYTDDENPDKARPVSIDLAKHKLQKRHIYDAQYDRKVTYRGVPLTEILNSYKPSASDDLAILHFGNGMAIPLPLDAASLTRLDPFLALEYCEPKSDCTTAFPTISKDEVYGMSDDPRPLVFTWNKLVVATDWHPDVPESKTKLFSPWRHADSLSGVEFVNKAAYYRQFELGQTTGERVFKQRCQFCHGIRYVGAKYGWDYVIPLPIFDKRTPEHLLNHVKYPKVLAKKMGLMMPTQDDVGLPEMQALWKWMKQAAKVKNLPSYQP